MTKLIVNQPDGNQAVITVGEGGGYNDLSRVIWDERKDGPFPENLKTKIGGLVREANGTLSVNQTMLLAQLTRNITKNQDLLDRKTKNEKRINDLNVAMTTLKGNASVSEIKDIVLLLVKEVLQNQLSTGEL